MGVPGGDGSGTGGDEAAVAGEIGVEDLVGDKDARAWVLLEAHDLDVGGAVLEVHDGPEGVGRSLVAGLEDGDEIFHVGDLGLGGRADVGVITHCSGGVGLSGNSGNAPKFRGMQHRLTGRVEKLGEGDAINLVTRSDDFGVLKLLEQALVHDPRGGQVRLLRC